MYKALALALALVLGLAACSDEPKRAESKPGAFQPGAQSAVTPADPNEELAQRVSRAIEEGKLDGIDVSVSDGVVTLWGTSGTAGERSRAAQIARNVEGVKSVENKVLVVSGS